MPRLFVAVEIPEAIKQKILTLQTKIPTARWVRPENMHITLRFIGEVEPAQADAAESALGEVYGTPFRLALSGTGRFPPGKRKAPRVLWLGIQGTQPLAALHDRVEAALRAADLPPGDNKPFKPHITLARLKAQKPVPAADQFLETNADFSAGAFTVESFVLIESELTRDGPRYSQRAVYSLQDGDGAG